MSLGALRVVPSPRIGFRPTGFQEGKKKVRLRERSGYRQQEPREQAEKEGEGERGTLSVVLQKEPQLSTRQVGMSAHASSSFGCAAVGCCRNALSRSRIAPKRSLLTAASTSTSDAAFNRPSAFPFSAMPKNARLTTPDMARQQQGPSAFGPDYNRVSRWSGAVPSSAATDTSTRSYSDTAALSAHSPGQSSPASSSSASNVSPDYDSSPESDLPGSILHQPDHAQITSHLNDLFEGLDPPINPQLAARMLTHKGAISPNAPPSRSQHNSRLSFLGEKDAAS